MPDLPDEAVEAAAWELAMELGHTVLDFETRRPAPNTVRIAHRALTAAAPHIAAQAVADLLAGIEALRDEWRAAADAAFAAYPNPIGTRDGFPRGYASAQSVHADALDALLRGA